MSDSYRDPPLLLHWESVVHALLKAADHFPKKVRFSVVRRMLDHGLDILEELVEARFSQGRKKNLVRASIKLEKLRFLLRISYERQWISTGVYERLVEQLAVAGKMLGGWLKHVDGESRA